MKFQILQSACDILTLQKITIRFCLRCYGWMVFDDIDGHHHPHVLIYSKLIHVTVTLSFEANTFHILITVMSYRMNIGFPFLTVQLLDKSHVTLAFSLVAFSIS